VPESCRAWVKIEGVTGAHLRRAALLVAFAIFVLTVAWVLFSDSDNASYRVNHPEMAKVRIRLTSIAADFDSIDISGATGSPTESLSCRIVSGFVDQPLVTRRIRSDSLSPEQLQNQVSQVLRARGWTVSPLPSGPPHADLEKQSASWRATGSLFETDDPKEVGIQAWPTEPKPCHQTSGLHI
jgi:hypothetical protein